MKESNSNIVLSVISPIYLAEKIIPELLRQLVQELEVLTPNAYEIILVEDGSPDQSWEVMEKIQQQYPQLRGIKLSRNFGQHPAITAGIAAAKGTWLIVMDCDLQDRPSEIPKLWKKKEEGFAIVFTRSPKIKQKSTRKWMANVYGKVYQQLIADKAYYQPHSRNLTLFNRQVANAFLNLKDQDRHFLMVLRWLGFKNTTLEVAMGERGEGSSSYTFRKLVLLGISGITSQSVRLLYTAILLGGGLMILSVIIGLILMINYISNHAFSVILCISSILFFCTSLVLITIGISSIYIGKIYEESKKRPIYIIEKEIG